MIKKERVNMEIFHIDMDNFYCKAEDISIQWKYQTKEDYL